MGDLSKAAETAEWKYRAIIGELAAYLAHARQPELVGAELIEASVQIVEDAYRRFGLPALGAGLRVGVAESEKHG